MNQIDLNYDSHIVLLIRGSASRKSSERREKTHSENCRLDGIISGCVTRRSDKVSADRRNFFLIFPILGSKNFSLSKNFNELNLKKRKNPISRRFQFAFKEIFCVYFKCFSACREIKPKHEKKCRAWEEEMGPSGSDGGPSDGVGRLHGRLFEFLRLSGRQHADDT